MKVKIPQQKKHISGEIFLEGSKSISNRLLVINYIGGLNLTFNNLSKSNDTIVMQRCLNSLDTDIIDVENCGTAMRFITALSAFKTGTRIITGDDRIKQRPIKPLADALIALGAQIEYLENEGFLPILIVGKECTTAIIKIDASISSQFISAILLVLPMLKNNIEIELIGNIVSSTYINMTLKLIQNFGINYTWNGNIISIENGNYFTTNNIYFVEADWSSASYIYAAVACADSAEVKIYGLHETSLQGDNITQYLFSFFGVVSCYKDDYLLLTKQKITIEFFVFDFNDNPDLAQTVAAVCAVLKIPCILKGLSNLNQKESKRIDTLGSELEKSGVSSKSTNNSIQLYDFKPITKEVEIVTHNDHRIAMAFFVMCVVMPVIIDDTEVVNKSYPNFFNDMKAIGFEFEVV